jgi:hypothetical protein
MRFIITLVIKNMLQNRRHGASTHHFPTSWPRPLGTQVAAWAAVRRKLVGILLEQKLIVHN